MAAAAVRSAPIDNTTIPSYNRVEAGSKQLTAASYPQSSSSSTFDAAEVVSAWVESFNAVLLNISATSLKSLFLKEYYWRDQLCLSWNYHTLNGPEKTASFFKNAEKGCRLQSVAVDDSNAAHRAPTSSPVDFNGNVKGVQSFLTLETDVGRGRGLVRLLQDPEDNGKWKAFTLFTTLRELKGHEEMTGPRRPQGVEHGGHPGRKNWQERREAEENYEGVEDPTVVIVGAGQAGLAVAARLKQLGINSLIIDRNSRIGDNWRNRYHQLVLHDPVWYDHLPYLEFPKNWPVFTPKDKLAEWFESYAKILELNVWTNATLTDTAWNETEKKWTITVHRAKDDGKKITRTFHPAHIIQATGHSGEKNFPSSIRGLDTFTGTTLCHSSEFKGASENGKGKRAIVVGCCNSGHDIAQDFYEHGYHVTMVQRSSTYVMSSKNGLDVLLGGLYAEDGPPVDDADLTFMSVPNPLLKRMHVDATTEISRRDHALLSSLRSAGFSLDTGPDASGFFMKYFQRGGGYYIDVGASALIADGQIAIKQGHEIEAVEGRVVRFDDGSELEADELVFATGYLNMRGTCAKIFGERVSDRVADVWGFDDEGEIRSMWRRSGHPGFWFMGGNLALCRYYSRLLALQIQGLETGVMGYGDE
ncbi:MAG: hypothetical protein M1819_007468 [Sarea resinae]|nr:MAG: hypothetical protein M1819_007468 [Sarea resinae]